jgi:hypothetical protein
MRTSLDTGAAVIGDGQCASKVLDGIAVIVRFAYPSVILRHHPAFPARQLVACMG